MYLFSVIGTTYGTGDGSTTFNVPDLRAKAIMGVAEGGTLGESQLAQLPAIYGVMNGIFFGDAPYTSGAFSRSTYLRRSYSASGEANNWSDTSFNSTRSGASTDHLRNNVYKANGETRPANVRMNFIIKT